jgi:hypothetical protein
MVSASITIAWMPSTAWARTVSRTWSALAKNSPLSTRRIATPGGGASPGCRARSTKWSPVPGHASEDGDVRPRHAVEQQQQRDRDAEEEPGQRVEDQHPEHRSDRADEVRARRGAVRAPERLRVDAIEGNERGDVDELDDRRDDHGGQRGLGQVLEEAGQEQQRDDREPGADQPGDLRVRTGSAVDRRLGEAPVDDHPGGQARGDVRGAETDRKAHEDQAERRVR